MTPDVKEWSGTQDRTEPITTALRRCIHDLRIDAANASVMLHLRTLPVLASGPVFQHSEEITLAIAR